MIIIVALILDGAGGRERAPDSGGRLEKEEVLWRKKDFRNTL